MTETHASDRRACAAVAMFVVMTALCCGGPRAAGDVIGQWDFSTGSIGPISGMSGLSTAYLPNTPFYSAFGGQPNPPALAFATTSSFGIANLGGSGSTQVLRIPDARGYGPVTGLMTTFPKLTNGGPAAARLNDYSVVMDVLIPAASFAGDSTYISLFQNSAAADAMLFVRKPAAAKPLGKGPSYGGDVTADAWHRIALVMSLDRPTSQPRYQAFLDGSLVSEMVWDDIILDSQVNSDIKDFYLVPDGGFAIGTLADSHPSLSSSQSAFFLFNDNNGEVGQLYVANLQFRDNALTAAEIAALGAAAPGPIAVPEPSTWALLASAAAAALSARRLRR
jgi:hypothetical protein